MNKILLVFLSCIMILGCINCTEVLAKESIDDVYQKEINHSIISGDGSFENPYILDVKKAPKFSQYLKEAGTKAINTLKEKNNVIFSEISNYALEDFLYGPNDNTKCYNNQKYGGTWIRTSGGMNINYNGSVTMLAIDYMGNGYAKAIASGLSTNIKKEIFKSYLEDIISFKFQDVVDKLLTLGFTTEAAKALAVWIGAGMNLYGTTMLLKEVNDFCKNEMYKTAASNGDGLIHAKYNTAYQGAWYSQSLTDYWTLCPTVYVPKSIYGVGTYTVRESEKRVN